MPERFASDDDLKICRQAIRGGSKSFFAASLLLPGEIRDRAYGLYGFCRSADDAVDEGDDPTAACEHLTERLHRIYDGQPGSDPIDRAFADVTRDCGIPRTLPAALIEGFAWDATGRQYETISDVRAYGARVAGSVGVMMALVMGTRSNAALARACDLGVAMQLTNIARDVGEDARNGRLYLPRTWLRQEGIDPDAWLDSPQFNPQIGRVVARLVSESEALYARALPGIGLLPRSCRAAIHAAARIYREIGREAARSNWNTVDQRMVTSTERKVMLSLASLWDATFLKGASHAQPLDETRYLLQAVPNVSPDDPEMAWWRVDEHWGRLIAILHEMEVRERTSGETAAYRRSGQN